MKIATKIVLGYALLLLLMVIVLAYEISLLQRMHEVNRNLSEVKTRETDYSLQARDIDQVDDFTRRLYVTGDPGYSEQLKNLRQGVSEAIAAVRATRPAGAEKVELDRLSELWSQFVASAVAAEGNFATMSEADFDEWLTGELDALNRQFDLVLAANQQAVDAEIRKSASAGQKAQFVAQVAAGIAILLSCLVSFLVFRSISHSLSGLIHGTRAVAQGEFSYRLEASGNDNFSQVARDFNFMISKLDELEQLKRDYVSHVSHELKAPLAAIQETCRLLAEGIPGPVNSKQQRLLNLCLDSGDRLRRTIISLLDLSRMEANAIDYEMERQDLRDVIRSATAEFEVRVAEKEGTLDLSFPPEPIWVCCDADRVRQIVSNLVDNALKFSPDKSPIRITAQMVTTPPPNLPEGWAGRINGATDKYALVQVVDSGRGVPDEHKELIFEKFHQVKFEKKIAGQGVGLGLVICRNIVSAHQGAIWVEDNSGGGSIFLILLPAVAQPVQQEAASQFEGRPASGEVSTA
jgi:signal transduction histidine kinase